MYPHSTLVAGFAPVYGGDDRFYNNIFIGKQDISNIGTDIYNAYTTSLEEYKLSVSQEEGDHEAFHKIKQPVYIEDNAYLNQANQFNREQNYYKEYDFNPQLEITEEGKHIYLNITLPSEFLN